MTFWQENRLRKPRWKLTDVVRGLKGPARWDPILQWGAAGLVGLFLGIYSVVVWSLPSKWALLSIPVVLAPFVAMVFGQVKKLLLAVILLDIPFQLDSFFAYRESALGGAVPGLVVSVTTLSLAVLYMLWLAELLAKPRGARSCSLFRLIFPLASYMTLVILSVIVAQDVQLSVFGIFLLVQMFLLYIYVVGTVRTSKEIVFIFTMLLIGLALESLIMSGLRIIGHSIEIGGVITARIDGGSRVGGTVGGPNGAAAYLSLMLAPALSIVLTRLDSLHKLLAIVAFGLGVIALVLTLSRGGWLAFSLSVAVLCFFAWRRGWLSLSGPLVAGVVALLLIFIFQDVIIGRLLGDDSGSADSRIRLLTIAYRVIVNNPIFGVGINNFTVRMLEYAQLDVVAFWSYAVHNNFMLVWAETGTAAIIAYLAFLAVTIYRGWKCWLSRDRLLSPLALGFTVAIVGHMVHMLFDLFNGRGPVQALWLNAGLVTAMFCICQENTSLDGAAAQEARTPSRTESAS